MLLKFISIERKKARLVLSEEDRAHAVNVNEKIKESRISNENLVITIK